MNEEKISGHLSRVSKTEEQQKGTLSKPFQLPFKLDNAKNVMRTNRTKNSDLNRIRKASQSPCCNRAYSNILSTQLVTHCDSRNQYVLLWGARPSKINSLQQCQQGTHAFFQNTVPAADGTKIPCCGKACRFNSGVSWGTNRKAVAGAKMFSVFWRLSTFFGGECVINCSY